MTTNENTSGCWPLTIGAYKQMNDANDGRRLSRIIDNMEKHGGGFARSLASAWRRADLENQRRLATAFHQMLEEYDNPLWHHWTTTPADSPL